MRLLIWTVVLVASTLALPGCRSARRPAVAAPRTTLTVRNQSFSDMTIYVVQSGSLRSRIGLASGNSTTTFVIPSSFVNAGNQLRFLADPIGGRAAPVSQEISVWPGDQVELLIPPQ